MSAWIVTKHHIDYLVKAITDNMEVKRVVDRVETKDEIGQMLWDENYKSVNCRYGLTDISPKYVYSKPTIAYNIYQALNAIDCLDYQSCEHDGWRDSDACKLLNRLEQVLIEKEIGGNKSMFASLFRKSKEYDKAKWGIE